MILSKSVWIGHKKPRGHIGAKTRTAPCVSTRVRGRFHVQIGVAEGRSQTQTDIMSTGG